MKYLYIVFLLSLNNVFAQSPQQAYDLLKGIWNSSSEGEMDIILNIDHTGYYELSIIPAFEYTNITTDQQKSIIYEHISAKGYFKIISILNPYPQNNGTLAQTEILLNGELSTNLLDITLSNIYIFNTNDHSKELFMTRETF